MYDYENVRSCICRRMQQSLSELTNDATAKQAALGLDRTAFKLRNTSRGLEFQEGIEHFDNTSVHAYVIASTPGGM